MSKGGVGAFMASSQSLGFGIVGCGLVSEFHARAIAGVEGARLVAAADPDAARRSAFAAKFGGEACEDHRAILENPDIQVVNICTPNNLHEQFVLDAAAARKHVMVEKPPEVSLDKADRMVTACQEAGVKFATILQVRFRPSVVALKRALDEGRFGRLLVADAQMKWYRPREYFDRDAWRGAKDRSGGGGVVMQHAFHYIDLLRWLTGGIASVRAQTYNLLHKDLAVEDSAVATFRYAEGAVGVLEASVALFPGAELRIELHGENGTVTIEGSRIRTWAFREERPGDAAMVESADSDQGAATGAADFGHAEHRAQIADMVAAVRDDREPAVTGRDGRDTLAAVLALYEAAETGKEIFIEE